MNLADYLRKVLPKRAASVKAGHNGVDGLHLAMEGQHDLIVCDSMFPGIDGMGVLAALRPNRQTPVIMLTARIWAEDSVRGLKAGADDYLTKPFAFSELMARIRHGFAAPGRAHLSWRDGVLGLADLEVDVVRRRAKRPGRHGEVLSHTKIAEPFGTSTATMVRTSLTSPYGAWRSKLDAPYGHPVSSRELALARLLGREVQASPSCFMASMVAGHTRSDNSDQH